MLELRKRLKEIRECYGLYFFARHPKLVLTTHTVNVYDTCGNFLYKDHLEHKNIVKIVRWPHNIQGQIVYSFIYYYNNGLMYYGMIADPGFSSTNLLEL